MAVDPASIEPTTETVADVAPMKEKKKKKSKKSLPTDEASAELNGATEDTNAQDTYVKKKSKGTRSTVDASTAESSAPGDNTVALSDTKRKKKGKGGDKGPVVEQNGTMDAAPMPRSVKEKKKRKEKAASSVEA